MSAAIVAFLAVIAQIAPALSSSVAIQNIINALIQIIPQLIGTIENLAPLVKNIVAGLQSNGAITPEQWTQLDQLNDSADKDFEDIASQFNPDGTPITPPATPGP
jgi:predicted PurR-regulated permease PerM